MLQKALSREQVKTLGEQVLVFMEEHIVERGYRYFSDGMVFNVQVDQGCLTSDVQGSMTYHVAIDLGTFTNSTCSCPYSRFCKHIAATFFQAYSVFENPRAFMSRLHQPRPLAFSSSLLVPAYKHTVKRNGNSSGMEAGRPVLPATSTVSDWWLFLDRWTRNLPQAMEAARASTELFSSYENVQGVTRDWPDDLAQLFSIHACLFHLQKLQEFVKEYRSAIWSGELAQTAERLVEQLEGILYYSDIDALWQERRSYLEQTAEKLRDWKLTAAFDLYGMLTYRLIWSDLLVQAAWRKQEVADLSQLAAEPTLPASRRNQSECMRAHFFVLDGRDEVALQIWERSWHPPLAFYLPYVKKFARNQEWQRLLAWIERMEGLIGTSEGQEYRLITAIWREAMAKLNRADECGISLKRYLPASFHDYAGYLFEHGHFQQWIDLQMTYGQPGAELSLEQEKVIEEKEPQLLLPLMIREINRLIEERNRTAYREAVKCLKKVRASYHKLNQTERWEQFMSRLAAKYSRLRAFQEEIRRGNLQP
ncbi:SWIM zinc finger family protein [Brevibacillus ruminantium]|uniref:SWIM zinc finger family protein n=1 Tax=Brevibacillus ruminantium TaxID=2950604 RepID=A0ABY4WDG1_9BACL|nr:SWIM zinc finger family protein [Brevibacillus ruminantium]USG63319.1 SWIM zinc finger family protein [Brevibacillus ruminantium]